MYEKEKEQIKKAADRKAKREEKRKSLPWGQRAGASVDLDKTVSQHQTKRKRRKRPVSWRRQAFNRLQAKCKEFVLRRAHYRTGGLCEVGMACNGFGLVEVWYHIFPQVKGNALKYDSRNILGSCNYCNAGEYEDRKSNSNIYHTRHRYILGRQLFEELQALQGRRSISTSEANDWADGFEKMIKDETWKLEK